MHLYAIKCKRKIYHFAKNKMKCSFPMKNIPPLVFLQIFDTGVLLEVAEIQPHYGKGIRACSRHDFKGVYVNITQYYRPCPWAPTRWNTRVRSILLIFWSYLQSETLDLEFRLRAHDPSKILQNQHLVPLST